MPSIERPSDWFEPWRIALAIGTMIGATGGYAFFAEELTRSTWLSVGLGLVFGIAFVAVECRIARPALDHEIQEMRSGTALEGRGMVPSWPLQLLRFGLYLALILLANVLRVSWGWSSYGGLFFGVLLPMPAMVPLFARYWHEWWRLYDSRRSRAAPPEREDGARPWMHRPFPSISPWPMGLLYGILIGGAGCYAFIASDVTAVTWFAAAGGLVFGALYTVIGMRVNVRNWEHIWREMTVRPAVEDRGMFPDWPLRTLGWLVSLVPLVGSVHLAIQHGWGPAVAVGFGFLIAQIAQVGQEAHHWREWWLLYQRAEEQVEEGAQRS